MTRVVKISLLFMMVMCAGVLQAQDSIRHDPSEYLSGTLPVLYVNTVDSMPIVSKDEYLQGSYWLDAEGFDQYESIGSADAPLPLQIKGRGNASWRYRKKPYRLKLDKKASLLGMPKNKHWVLLAAFADWRCHARDYIYLKVAAMMQMPWTPGIVPCEVVINGDYMGMYYLTEKIRVDKDRVNIVEQPDLCTDPDSITGGWLLEIDNYREPNQINLHDIDNTIIRFTYHTPEVLSAEQKTYLTDLLNKTNDAVNTTDKSSTEWEKYIDIEALARFYVIQEAVDNQEAFSGSCWFYKDYGDTTKFIFGPTWDSGSTLGSRLSRGGWGPHFLYDTRLAYAHNHWIKEICKYPRFQIALRKYWHYYRDEVFPQLEQLLQDYRALTEQALLHDYMRWNDASAINMDAYMPTVVYALTNKYNFLKEHWDADYVYPLGDVNLDGLCDVTDVNIIINHVLGKNNQSDHLDVNGDGFIDITDINVCINSILGKKDGNEASPIEEGL